MAEGEVSNLGAAALSAGVGALGSIAGSVGGGLFSANQARKNRAFQERMYKKQVEDTLNFWNMQNEYNLPSAQLQRLKDAGLNPMLMYGQSGVQNVSTGSPDLPSAPHGAQGSVGSFNTPLELANLALLNAQTKLANSQANKNDVESEESRQRAQDIEQDVLLKRLTKDINVAIRYRDYDFLNTSIDEMRNNIFNNAQFTTQQVLTLAQGRQYQIKQYNLDEWQVGQQIAQGWDNIAIGKMNASAALKQAAAAWKSAVSLANLNNAQIGEINNRVYSAKKLFPELERQTKWMTKQQQLDYFLGFALKGLDISQKQVDVIKSKVGVVRSRLGNDTGIGSIIAPFQMPVYDPVKFYNENYGN